MSTDPPPAAPDANRPRLRGLWGMMPSDAPTNGEAEASTPDTGESPPSTKPADVAEADRSAPKGLWSVMRTDATTEPAAEPAPVTSAESLSEVESTAVAHAGHSAPKSLWEVMRSGEADEAVVEEVESVIPHAEPWTESPEADASVPSLHGVQPVGFAGSRLSTLDNRPPIWPLVCGALAATLSVLAALPGFWMSVPAALSGFLAVLWAVSIWTEKQTSSHRRSLAALAGALGALGLIAGPLVFTPLGNRWRETASPQITERHLRKIGAALDRHHQERGAYPPGGTTIRDADGRERGGHGWLTALLPYVDARGVFQQIDLSLPYDDPVNRPPLATPIEAYHAAGGDRTPHASGLAVAHFAGVGGDVVNPRGEVLGAGIFTRNRAVQKDEIRDGLSQTLVAGELPGGYPPWGDPENFRTVGRGLNREARGFGNAAATGATMLFADGSVRFFSNRTDPELLRRLSTRDGADGVGR